ncbi:MAG: oligosaccharide flippase family protein [Candidatus Thorarchaeota archaeon]
MNSEGHSLYELRLVSRGASLVMAGVLFSTAFDFIGRLVMANNLTQSDYGTIALGLRLLQIALFVSLVGVNVGIPPLMATSVDDDSELRYLIGSALIISMVSSSLVTITLFLLSHTLEVVYAIVGLGQFVGLLAWAVIPIVLIKVITGILRGFNEYKPKVLIEDLLLGSSRFTFIIIAILVMAGVSGIAVAVAGAGLGTSVAYVVYYIRFSSIGISINKTSTKRVFAFSAPLLWKGLANEITVSIDILLLGVFTTSSVVGVFSATVTLSQAINLVLLSLTYLYSPVAAQIISRRNYNDAGQLYTIASKWSLVFTFPLFMLLVLYPQTVLLLFGNSYIVGETSLRILSFAYFIHAILGLSGITVTSSGKPTIEAAAWTLGVPTAFTASFFLIPIWSSIGAAIGTLLGISAVNLTNTLYVKRALGVYPFSVAHVRSIIGALSLCVFMVLLFPEPQGGFSLIFIPLIALGLIVLSTVGVLVAGGFSREDVVFLELIEDITKVKMLKLRSLLSRIIR